MNSDLDSDDDAFVAPPPHNTTALSYEPLHASTLTTGVAQGSGSLEEGRCCRRPRRTTPKTREAESFDNRPSFRPLSAPCNTQANIPSHTIHDDNRQPWHQFESASPASLSPPDHFQSSPPPAPPWKQPPPPPPCLSRRVGWSSKPRAATSLPGSLYGIAAILFWRGRRRPWRA